MRAESLNKTPMPVLALAARQTTAIWSALAEWKVPFPPGGVKSKVPKVSFNQISSLTRQCLTTISSSSPLVDLI